MVVCLFKEICKRDFDVAGIYQRWFKIIIIIIERVGFVMFCAVSSRKYLIPTD